MPHPTPAPPPPERWPRTAPVLIVSILIALLAIVGVARSQPSSDAPPLPQPDWVTWVDPAYGFAVELPPSHRLARSATEWYVHGMLDGEPLVPDVSISFREGRDAQQLLARYEDDASVEDIAFGPGTRGLEVVSARRAPDGTPYLIDTYLVEAPDGSGTFRILRYEGFEWVPFEAVARSFRFVRETGDPLP